MDDSHLIVLRTLTEDEVSLIRGWPPYPAEFTELDYALREGGWLDQFLESASTRRFGAWKGDELVGFSILTHIAAGSAEFYVAVRPGLTGGGLGLRITEETTFKGFRELGLDRIYLKVRTWHERGIGLYSRVGFVATGERDESINGNTVRFLLMELERPQLLENGSSAVRLPP